MPFCLKWLIRIIYSADIPYQLQIGQNVHFAHAGLGIVIHPRSIIGDNVTINQHVTIGGSMGKYEVPQIGNFVLIGAGAKILGDVVIGNYVIIGANTVVVKSIPNNTIVGGVPAKKIRNIEANKIIGFLKTP